MINGVFLAQVKDTSTLETIDSLGFSKTFTSIMSRKVKYEKVDDSYNPEGYSWKITALTPLYGGAGDKVSITSNWTRSVGISSVCLIILISVSRIAIWSCNAVF